jgi:hypothetical protein
MRRDVKNDGAEERLLRVAARAEKPLASYQGTASAMPRMRAAESPF